MLIRVVKLHYSTNVNELLHSSFKVEIEVVIDCRPHSECLWMYDPAMLIHEDGGFRKFTWHYNVHDNQTQEKFGLKFLLDENSIQGVVSCSCPEQILEALNSADTCLKNISLLKTNTKEYA